MLSPDIPITEEEWERGGQLCERSRAYIHTYIHTKTAERAALSMVKLCTFTGKRFAVFRAITRVVGGEERRGVFCQCHKRARGRGYKACVCGARGTEQTAVVFVPLFCSVK